MKNLTTNATAFRNLFPLAIMMLGLLLWIPQSWAATIHSVAAGGDWNKAETWVGGQVPTKNDNVVVNGVVITGNNTVAGLTVSSQGTVVNSYSRTLTVNGNVLNNGSILDNTGYSLTLNISGNLTNNGILKNKLIRFIDDSIVGKITAINPIGSTEVSLNTNVEIVGNVTFSEKFSFNGKQLIINQPSIVTFKDINGNGSIEGMGTLWLTGAVSFNLSGNIQEIVFRGADQTINGTFTANTIIFGGSGIKTVGHIAVNGSMIVNKGVTVVNSYSRTLTVNGNVLNNGSILDNTGYSLTLKIAGNILNNGTWNNYRTTLTFPSGEFRMTGTPTWEKPYRGNSYNITDYLTTQHHWQVRVDGGPWSEYRGINDPSLVALPTVPVSEITSPPKESSVTLSEVIKPKVYITTNRYLYSKESPYISVYLSTDVEGAEMTEALYDIYVAIGGPDGLALFDSGQGVSGLTAETRPYLANVTVMQSDWVETFNYEFTEHASAGDYFVHIAVLSKEGRLISEDSVDFLYDPDYKDPFIAMETSARRSYARTDRAGSLSDGLKDYYPELKSKLKMYDVVNGKDCDIDETQRDFLLVAGMMEHILNKYSVYKGANIKFAGALKEIYKGENQRLIAYQSVLAGSVFLKFEHVTRWWRVDSVGQRNLKVEVKPIFYFPSDWRGKIYHHQMSASEWYVYNFEVQSKKKNWGDNKHELTSVTPGAYSITATDMTNGRVYRTNRVLKKLGETVTLTFDYDGDYDEISTQPTGIECF